MWQIYFDMIQPDKDDLIICPITGGLDSRVVAAVLAQKQVQFISYYVYDETSKKNLPYIKKIAAQCNVKNLHFIHAVNGESNPQTVVNYLSKTYNLKDYIKYIPLCNDMITGLGITKKRHRKYWSLKDIEIKEISKHYKKLVDCTCNQKWVGYCYSLPFTMRLFQRGYIKMINEFTDLGDIPRCFENNQEPVKIDRGTIYYVMKRVIQKFR